MIVRVTWILIEDDKILLLNQVTTASRSWSLPWWKVDPHESLEEALIREMKEETWLDVSVWKMIYVCDLIDKETHVLHITFLTKRIWWVLWDIAEWLDTRKIKSVDMIDICSMTTYWFSQKFQKIIEDWFPDSWSYKWSKSNIWL